ncbi:hypothetical protein ACFT8W_27155 [Streptomyces hygroscopicus]|uniref:hypothetical protein n=1 Tax=Streptomyces hygroscopicus TaxID=1912 RepID=UPI00363DD66C
MHVNTLLLQQVLAEPAWALTALFWSDIKPHGTLRLDMDKRIDLLPVSMPGPVARPTAPQTWPDRHHEPLERVALRHGASSGSAPGG